MMIINHNLSALNAWRQLSINNAATQNSLEKLSSGFRINRAGDDAAGLAISEKMRAQISGLDQASRNAQDAISMIQTAEGALNETHSILQRMRELAVQAGNDTYTPSDRVEIQLEMNQLTSEINRIGNTTEFNTQKLLNATSGATTAATSGTVVGTATVTGSAITIGTGTDFSSTNLIFDITVGSTTKTVTLSQNYDGTTNTIDTLVNDINTQLDGIATVSQNAGALVITASTNNVPITIGNVTSGSLSAIGLTAGTTNVTAGTVTAANTGIQYQGTYTGQNDVTLTLKYDSTNNVYQYSTDGTNFTNITWDSTTGKATLLGVPGITLTKPATDPTADQTDTISLKAGQAATSSFTMQIGANQNQTMTLQLSDMRAAALGISSTTAGAGFTSTQTVTDGTNNTAVEYALDVSTAANAGNAVTTIQNAIDKVSAERSKLGAYQNRLEHTINNLGTSSENLTAAESRIRDVDMAQEMMNFTKNNILQQAATAMLAQANQQPQLVLQLLR